MSTSFMNFNDLTRKQGEALVADLTRSIRLTQGLRQTTKTGYHSWKKAAKPQTNSGDNPTGSIFEMMFMSFLMHALFGMPMLHGLGLDDQSMESLGMLGSGLHHDQAKGNKPASGASSFATATARARLDHALSAQNNRLGKLSGMKRNMLLMLMELMLQDDEGSEGGGEDGIVPDVLRHPKIARFKQNRHSMECVRTLFRNQSTITAPKFPTPHIA